MEDSQIIALYWQRNTAAIEETNKKYGSYCFSVAEHILQNNQDAEECVNDTWLRAWNAIPPQKPAKLSSFLAKIIRNLALDRYTARCAEKRGGGELALVLEELAQCIPAACDVAREYEYKELVTAIQKFAFTLPKRECNVFLRRYFYTEAVAEIAGRYGLSQNHVLVMLSRTRRKLRKFLEKEGFLNG